MAVSSFNSTEVTGVTQVLELDPMERSLNLLKILENCKDYFRLRLLA